MTALSLITTGIRTTIFQPLLLPSTLAPSAPLPLLCSFRSFITEFAYTGEVRLRVACEGRIISVAHTFRVKEGPNPSPALRLDLGSEGGGGGGDVGPPVSGEPFGGGQMASHHAGYPPLVKTASADAAPECDSRWFLQFSGETTFS